MAAKDFRTAANLEESQTVSIVTFDRVLKLSKHYLTPYVTAVLIASTVNLPSRQ